MQALTVSNLSNENTQEIEDQRLSVVRKIFNNQLGCAFQHSYLIDDESAQHLQDIFAPTIIHQNTTVGYRYKTSSHPIPAIINEYCNVSAAKIVNDAHSRGEVAMTLGDSITHKIADVHNCILLDDKRSAYRTACAATSSSADPGSTKIALNATTDCSTNFLQCYRGAENCHFEADICVAVHSVYDINADKLVDIFRNHKLKSLVAFMYIPLELYDSRLSQHDEKFFKLQETTNNYVFSLLDFAAPYVHSKETWRQWAKFTTIRCSDFVLVRETIEHRGPLQVINIVRVDNYPGDVLMTIPINKIVGDMTYVPSFIHADQNDYSTRQRKLHHYLVPTYIVNAMLAYANRTADEAYKFVEFATVWSGVTSKVRFGGVVTRSGWDASPTSMFDVCLSLFLLGATQRRMRTQIISATFTAYKHNGSDITDTATRSLPSMMYRYIMGKKNKTFVTENANSFCVNNFRVLPVNDVTLNHNINVGPIAKLVSDRCLLATRKFITHDAFCEKVLDVPSIEDEVPPPSVDCGQWWHGLDSPHTTDDEIATEPSHIEEQDPFVNYGCDTISEAEQYQSEIQRKNVAGMRARLSDYVFGLLPTPTVEAFADSRNNHIANYVDRSRNFFTTEVSEKDLVYANPPFTSTYYDGMLEYMAHHECIYILIVPDWQDVHNRLLDYKHISYRFDGARAFGKPMFELDGKPYDIESDIYIYFVNTTKSTPTPRITSFSGVVASVRYGRDDSTFLDGHCAMQAYMEAYRLNVGELSPARVQNVAYHRLCQMVSVDDGGEPPFSVKQAADYIYRLDYQNSASHYICDALCRAFAFQPKFVFYGAGGVVKEVDGEGLKSHIEFRNFHYTHVVYGGAADKFHGLIDFVYNRVDYAVCHDLSASPGHFSDILYKTGRDVYAYHYAPGISRDDSLSATGHAFYNNVNDIRLNAANGTALFFVDASDGLHTERIVDDFLPFVLKHIRNGDGLLLKVFAPSEKIRLATTCFRGAEYHTSGVGSERYLHLYGYDDTREFAHDVDVPVTEHHFVVRKDDVARFCDRHFRTIRKDYRDVIRGSGNVDFIVTAITGYASAAKTSVAVDKYPDALYIVPSKELRSKLEAKGVKAATQHNFVDHNGYSTVVIDEVSQFPAEFIALVRVITGANVVVLGDIHQIPYSTYGYHDSFTSVSKFGITNNISRVYKIPQDIASYLNHTRGWRIVSESPVARGLVRLKDDIRVFTGSDIPVLCFNTITASNLRDAGVNAHTVSTYQGSRVPTVAVYIDSAAIASNIAAKPEWIYTAITRGTECIAFVGEHPRAIMRGYDFSNTLITTFEEISGNRMHSDAVDAHHDTDIHLPIATEHRVAKDTVLPTTECSHIIAQQYNCVNEAYDAHAAARAPALPDVEDGKFSAPLLAITQPAKEVKCFKLVGVKRNLVKNQPSNDPFVTAESAIGRYAKRRPHLTPKDKIVTYTQLTNGLSYALYGNRQSYNKLKEHLLRTRDQLHSHAADYITALQKKLNVNPSVAKDLKSEFSWFDETLSYFNKRQGKFDPQDGFDQRNKVGQGVMSMSKKINIIFSAYARYILSVVRYIAATSNGRKFDLLIATHDSEETFATSFASVMSTRVDQQHKWANNDFSEWDASYRQPFTSLMWDLMVASGCPTSLATEFKLFRAKWKAIAHTKHGNIVLQGNEKQFSGNPFTICENTIGNMAMCFAVFTYEHPTVALFKGDDSSVYCRSVRITTAGSELVKKFGHGLKQHTSAIGEFAGWLILEDSLFPDVVRQAAKFMSKLYRNEEHYRETQASLNQRVRVVANSSQLEQGCHAVSSFYSSITPEQVRSLFYYIRDMAYAGAHHLAETTLPTLQL